MVWDAWDLAGRFGHHAFSYSLPKKLATSGVDFSWAGVLPLKAMASSSAGAVEWLSG